MRSRFEESPEEVPVLTPEVAERVVERFMERQAELERETLRERERQAEVARVQELADLLGTTPEDVVQLAREVSPGAEREEEVAPKPVARRPQWPLHFAYLSALAVALVWGFTMATRQPTFWAAPGINPPIPLPKNGVGDVALRFDPYLGGYTREAFGPLRFSQGEVSVVDPDVKAPPTGLKVTLVTPLGRKAITGVAGKVPDSPQAAKQLTEAIRSLVAYEEALVKVEGNLPTVDYDKASLQEGSQNWSGSPTYVGWHQIEVTDGRHTFRRLLPDRRYAKDLVRFKDAFEKRITSFADTKFFPGQPPANLRPGSRRIEVPESIPKGISLMVWSNRQTIWIQGKSSKPKVELGEFQRAIGRAASKLNAGDASNGSFNMAAIYPGGETYAWWPTDAVQPSPIAKREQNVRNMTTVVASALEIAEKVRTKGRVLHSADNVPPTHIVETDSGTFGFQADPSR